MKSPTRLILASQSPARRRLLAGLLRTSFPAFRLRLCPVNIDERGLQKLFKREQKISDSRWSLAQAKALATTLASRKRLAAETNAREGDLVLGCDQVVFFEGRIFGKPGNHQRAIKMLTAMSGNKLYLINAMSLAIRHAEGRGKAFSERLDVQVIELVFAQLEKSEIERMLKLDQPYSSAGSFHFENHGANLLKSVRCDDPTGIQGLPVMRLRSMLSVLSS